MLIGWLQLKPREHLSLPICGRGWGTFPAQTVGWSPCVRCSLLLRTQGPEHDTVCREQPGATSLGGDRVEREETSREGGGGCSLSSRRDRSPSPAFASALPLSLHLWVSLPSSVSGASSSPLLSTSFPLTTFALWHFHSTFSGHASGEASTGNQILQEASRELTVQVIRKLSVIEMSRFKLEYLLPKWR